MLKIVLLGYMGVGKSTIGKLLSEKLKMSYVDLDEFIEKREEKSISQLFLEKGEIYFRKVEAQYLDEILENSEHQIVILGGGTPCYANNHLKLQGDHIESIYLQARIDTIVNRLGSNKSTRPMIANLSDEELPEFVAKHLFDRSYFYYFAKHQLQVDDKTPLEVVRDIENLLA